MGALWNPELSSWREAYRALSQDLRSLDLAASPPMRCFPWLSWTEWWRCGVQTRRHESAGRPLPAREPASVWELVLWRGRAAERDQAHDPKSRARPCPLAPMVSTGTFTLKCWATWTRGQGLCGTGIWGGGVRGQLVGSLHLRPLLASGAPRGSPAPPSPAQPATLPAAETERTLPRRARKRPVCPDC